MEDYNIGGKMMIHPMKYQLLSRISISMGVVWLFSLEYLASHT